MKYISILAFLLTLGACATQKTPKVEPFTVNFNSPKISAGTFTAQFDKTLSIMGLRQIEVSVDYYPLEDAVSLQYRMDFMTYYQCWSIDGRNAFINALKQYKEDFDQRTLSLKGSKSTRRQYGKVEGYLIWQAAALLTRARTNADIDLGYDVKEVDGRRSPFFSIYQRETTYTDPNSQNDRRTAQNIQMYLTRADAEELAAFFDQDLLKSLIPERGIRQHNGPIAPDIY